MYLCVHIYICGRVSEHISAATRIVSASALARARRAWALGRARGVHRVGHLVAAVRQEELNAGLARDQTAQKPRARRRHPVGGHVSICIDEKKTTRNEKQQAPITQQKRPHA